MAHMMVWTQQSTKFHCDHGYPLQLLAACRQQRTCRHQRPAASTCAAGTNSSQVAPIAPVKLDPETKARHKRPAGWVAPGPQPYGNPSNDPALIPQEHETLSFLTGDWRILQLHNGHRWSMDDMMTAYIALQEAAEMQRQAAAAAATHLTKGIQQPQVLQQLAPIAQTLDIGCGIGSVLLMVAWGLRRMHMEQQAVEPGVLHPQQQQQQQQQQQEQPGHPAQQQSYTSSLCPQQQQELGQADQQQQQPQQLGHADRQQRHHQQQLQHFSTTSLGVEAQTTSYRLAQRSILYNVGPDAQKQIQVINADLREGVPVDIKFQLITGTPPYIPQGAGGRSVRPQKEPCCLEIRGGIEDYCTAAAGALAPDGVFVACMGLQGQPAQYRGRRTQMAAAAAGLVITRQVTVITREGKQPLFAVYVMRRAHGVLQYGLHWQQHQQLQGGSIFDKTSPKARRRVQQPELLVNSSFERQVASGQLQGAEEQFVVQYADGRHTDAWHAAREAMGLPPLV